MFVPVTCNISLHHQSNMCTEVEYFSNNHAGPGVVYKMSGRSKIDAEIPTHTRISQTIHSSSGKFARILTDVSCCVRPFIFSQHPMRLEAYISTTSSRVFAIFFLHPAAPCTLRWEVEVEHAAVSEDCKFVASPLFTALVA